MVYSTRRFVVCLSGRHFVLVFFSPFGAAVASLGGWGGGGWAGAGRSWSWCFSYVCSVCACLDLSVSSSSLGLRRAAVCDCDTPWSLLLPFLPCLVEIPVVYANFVDPDQTPRFAASDQGLHNLPISLLWDAELKWFNGFLPVVTAF